MPNICDVSKLVQYGMSLESEVMYIHMYTQVSNTPISQLNDYDTTRHDSTAFMSVLLYVVWSHINGMGSDNAGQYYYDSAYLITDMYIIVLNKLARRHI
jgi:hypothetical protein